MQLRKGDKVQALILRECGWNGERVAAALGVHKRIIQRLEASAKKLKKGEISRRKVGFGPRETYEERKANQ